MRGIYTPVTKIRRQVFAEIAKLAYEDKPLSELDEIPYRIIPGEIAAYRDSVFKERAIVGERLRLAMGLPLRKLDEHTLIANGAEQADVDVRYYEPPLVNVIRFACNKCEETSFTVTSKCVGCLAHPCTAVCPVSAVRIENGKSVIDKGKCIKCGRCQSVCPYSAICKNERPCSSACGVNAIENDEHGRARINQDKCVSCGMCLVNCPFAAIADKSQIYQLIKAMKNGHKVVAAVAPAFVGQFGSQITPDKIKSVMRMLGFDDVVEVAIGADIGAVEEAEHFIKDVPNNQPLIATSCCPSWSVMAKRYFPTLANCVSDGLTPMVLTARKIKEECPDVKVVFVGPCAAKKLEAARRSVESHVDFVITFEELMGMMAAKNINFDSAEEIKLTRATAGGRGYGAAGGVADAIVKCIKKIDPSREVPVDRAEGLSNCKKMLMLAKAGKRNGYLLEGMACPGGCVGGAGTILPINKATEKLREFANSSEKQNAFESEYIEDENK